ncbi:MAG: anion permease [Candidatus Dormibacteria bacterium]
MIEEKDLNFELAAIVAVALFFDFTNGFHDSANAIATTVSTRALPPRIAVVFAGLLNFAGAFISLKVAATVAQGIITPTGITLSVVLAGVIGATAWNLLTWLMGLPTSSSHALIGGVIGAAITSKGFGVLQVGGFWSKVLLPSLLSPLFGLLLAALILFVLLWLLRRQMPARMRTVFLRLQVVSAGFVALTHGTNDAQKTMGVIALALIAGQPASKFHVPIWVIVSAATAMALGTYTGGWRIIQTLGRRVTKLEPYEAFSAEASTATLLGITGFLGFPVSTTHTITGSVLGAGAVRHFRALRWGVARNILIAWAFTLPFAGIAGAAMELLTRVPFGTPLTFSVGISIAVAAFAYRNHMLNTAASPAGVGARPRAA